MTSKSLLLGSVVVCFSICTFANTLDAQSKNKSTDSTQLNTAGEKSAQTSQDQKDEKDTKKKKDAPKDDKNFWMDRKLKFSKEILTGLAGADFDRIEKNARLMRGLNRIEAFMRGRKEGYRDQLKQFNMANDAILEAAKEDNLAAATLGFNQLTISCVNCHKHLRQSDDSLKSTDQ